jgi:hypothetical protein
MHPQPTVSTLAARGVYYCYYHSLQQTSDLAEVGGQNSGSLP